MPLGPGDYEVKVDITKNKSPSLEFVSRGSKTLPDAEQTLEA